MRSQIQEVSVNLTTTYVMSKVLSRYAGVLHMTVSTMNSFILWVFHIRT